MSKIIKARNLTLVDEKIDEKAAVDSEVFFTKEDATILYEETKAIVQELIAEAEKKAKEIIAKAQEQGKTIIEKSQKESEQLKKQAYEKAYQEGLEKGQNQGYMEYQSLKEEARLQIEKAYQEREKIIANTEKEIIGLAFQIAEKIIRYKIQEDETINSIVKELLRLAKNSDFIILKVNSNEINRLSEKTEELKAFVSPGKLKLEEDNSLKDGEAIVISQIGIIEAKIEPQLEELKKAFSEVKPNA